MRNGRRERAWVRERGRERWTRRKNELPYHHHSVVNDYWFDLWMRCRVGVGWLLVQQTIGSGTVHSLHYRTLPLHLRSIHPFHPMTSIRITHKSRERERKQNEIFSPLTGRPMLRHMQFEFMAHPCSSTIKLACAKSEINLAKSFWAHTFSTTQFCARLNWISRQKACDTAHRRW